MKFSIINFGCKLNIYEAESMTHKLLSNGHQYVENYTDADFVIINSCTVTNKADSKINYTIRKIKRERSNIFLVVAGCTVDTDKDALYKNNLVDLLIPNRDKDKIEEAIDRFFKKNEKKQNSKTNPDYNDKLFRSDIDGTFNFEPDNFINHSRAFVKIQDGCNNYCSYCKIPYARGEARSDSFENILRRIKNIEDNGYSEVVLTGINIGNYNFENINFSDLLLKILENSKNIRIRLSSLEPIYFNDKLLEVLKNERICPHFHIALQSGSDRILKLMNRKYDTKFYLNIIEKIKNNFENPFISTDLIVGFPTETDEDFQDTLRLIKQIEFSYIHIFPFSPRNGTKAITIKPFVKNSIVTERVKIVTQLNNFYYEKYIKNNVGKTFDLLIETEKKIENGYLYSGTTENYLEIQIFSENKLIPKKIYKALTEKVDGNTLIGKII